jgi:hypothetical protein
MKPATETPDVGDPAAAEDLPTTCYGFEVRSSIELRYLRPGSGVPLEVTAGEDGHSPTGEPVRRWIPRDDHPFEAALYQDDGVFRLWVRGTGWYVIDPRVPSIQVPAEGDPVPREERLWGFPAALCFIQRRDLPLHAAAVEAGERALLLAAPGRFGKTTLAGAFLRAGSRVLSEDISCCALGEDLSVIPGPAMLRVRHDSYERLELPGTRRIGHDEDRVHLALEGRARGDAAPVPLAGIVLLRQAEHHTSLERVQGPDALQDLWALSFKLDTEPDRIRCFQAVVDLANRVPIWNLHRPLDYGSVGDVVDQLIETCLPDR